MAALTIDASAALRIVFDASQHAEALERVRRADTVYAPSLFVVETANALWKYIKARQVSEESALRMHRQALSLVDRSIDGVELFPEALLLAAQLRHPVYDTLYLVVARRTGSALMTSDHSLAEIARTLDIEVVVH